MNLLPQIANIVDVPTYISRLRCRQAQTIARAATSGSKIGGTGCGCRGILHLHQSNCGVFIAGSCTIDVEESSVKRSGYEESLASAAGAANKADKAVKDTAQRYLKLFGIQVDLDDIEKKIRDRPFLYLALAAGAGFTIGGGLAINMGVALLGIFGRRAAAETTTNFVRQFVHRTVSSSKPQPMMLRH
jgi:hypothetical protein